MFGRKQRSTARLALVELEARLCLSSNGPYLLVTSYGTDSVQRYDELTGAPMPAPGNNGADFIAPHTSPLSTPLDVLFTPDGYLLVDSAEDNDVLLYDGQSGQYLSLLVPPVTPNLAGPTGMIFSPDGSSFFLASVGNHTVLRFDYANGVASNPTPFITDPATNFPAALVFGPDGNLYVGSLNNSSVLRFDGVTGDPLPAPGQSGADFVPSGSGGLTRTAGIVFGSDGNLYVSSETSSEVMRYDGTTGDPLPALGQSGAVFIPQGTGLSQPAGMVFGPGNDPTLHHHVKFDLYIANENNNDILRFKGKNGKARGEFIAAGSNGLSHPRDVTFGNTDPSSLDYVYPTGPTENTPDSAASIRQIASAQVRPFTPVNVEQTPSFLGQSSDVAVRSTDDVSISSSLANGLTNSVNATPVLVAGPTAAWDSDPFQQLDLSF
jgi:WD40 repeat protein